MEFRASRKWPVDPEQTTETDGVFYHLEWTHFWVSMSSCDTGYDIQTASSFSSGSGAFILVRGTNCCFSLSEFFPQTLLFETQCWDVRDSSDIRGADGRQRKCEQTSKDGTWFWSGMFSVLVWRMASNWSATHNSSPSTYRCTRKIEERRSESIDRKTERGSREKDEINAEKQKKFVLVGSWNPINSTKRHELMSWWAAATWPS